MELAAKTRLLLDRIRTRLEELSRRLDTEAPATTAADAEFFPNFCAGWVVFNVMVVAELLAIFIALLMPRNLLTAYLSRDFLLISLFIQWIALAGAGALCLARTRLNRLPHLQALGAAYALLLAVTFLVGELTLWLLWATGRLPAAHAEWYAEFHVLNLSLSAIINGLLLRYLLAKHELQQRTLSEARARMQALQSRIRPHFVFNSLNIIASLTRSAPEKAEAAIENMADLFRMMLSEDETLVPLKNEVEVTKKYLALEQLRLDSRLSVDWDIGTFPRRAAIPVLTLQPLLENAIRHGIEELPAGGTVRVRLWEERDKIHIRVVNPLPPAHGKSKESGHIQSLENIRRRLHTHYGDSATLSSAETDGQFAVLVELPVRGGIA